MAYTTLATGSWGTGPKIPITFYYDYQRSGSSMQYKVKIVLGAVTGASYFGFPIYTTISLDGTAKVSGYTLKSASPSQWSSGITYETGWLTVSGKTTGTTALTIRLYSGSGNTRDTSYAYSLYVAPAATTPTFSSTTVTMGQSVTINLPRASSSFTHRVVYAFGSAGGVIAEAATTSTTWTPPISLATQIPNATSGTCTIGVGTWSGNTLIGTKEVTITLTVPSSVVPTVDGIAAIEATSGLAAKFGAFVQNKTTLSVSVSASGSHGSSITSYQTTVQSSVYKGASFTTGVITASGTVNLSTIVTDSRGRTASYSRSITVVAYSPPEINAFSAYRITSAGVASDDGNRLAMQMKFAIASVGGKNDRTYNFKYRKSTDTDFTSFASGTASTSYDDTQYFTSSPEISTDYAYVIRLEIADYFQTVAYEVEIPTAFTIMDFRNTGKGMAIGKVSEKDRLELAMDTDVTGALRIYAPTASAADGAFIRMLRSDASLAAFLATSDNGDGLNLHLYSGGAWSGVVKITKDGAVVAKNLSYGTATTG